MDLGVLREPPLGKFLESGLFTGQDLTVFHPLLELKGEAARPFQLLGERLGSGVKVAVWRSFLPRMS